MSSGKYYCDHFRYSELSPSMQKKVAKEYLEGWLETHPKDKNTLDLEWATARCRDLNNEVDYSFEGELLE